MDTSGSQLWDQVLTQQFKVEGELCCRKLINIFEEANIQYFDMEASFMEEYQLAEFQAQWDLQNNSEQNIQYKGLKQKKRYYLQRPQDYPFQEIMQIGDDPIRGLVFMQIYRVQLQRMKQDYDIRISTNGVRLYIFMRRKESLNIMCRNTLLDMNRSLRIFYGHQPSLIFIVNASFMLRKQLQEKGINVWFKRVFGKKMAVFFSVTMEIKEMLPVIQEITQCDISVFDFEHRSISETQAMAVKQVVEQALKQDILFLNQQYEMTIEFSKDNCFIVFHTKHAIFGNEPVTIFQERLNNLVILSLKSHNIKEFDNRIRKLLKKTEFVFEHMNKKRNETYMAIDLSKIHGKNAKKDVARQVQEFLKLFILLIQPKFQLKLYFNHMKGDLEKCFKRMIDLIEDHNLIIKNHSFYDLGDRKVIVQLKDLSENIFAKRQKELLLFLNAMISLPLHEDKGAVSILDQATIDNLGSITNMSSFLNNSRGEESIMDEKFEVPWLKVHYLAPIQKKLQIQDQHYAKDRKQRALIDLFNAHSQFKFQVWSIHLSSTLNLPTHNISPKPYLFRQMFKDKKINDSCQKATLSSFQLKQQGAIGFMTNEIAMPVIPLFIFQRIH